MIGATLGGGVSRYNGLHGMIVDSLSSVRMVTAAGDIVTASKTQNKDLFWGMRGAGLNYGTVVEATYDIYPETAPQVLSANFLFPPNASQPLLEYFKSFGNNLPAKLSLVLLGTDLASFGGVSLPNAMILLTVECKLTCGLIVGHHHQRCLCGLSSRGSAVHPASFRS
jgi:hypothetical protein